MRIFTLLIALLLTNFTIAQTTIKGVISDENGPLPFANVILKGTTNGVTSDIDGRYEIKVPAGAITLIYSSIGFESVEKNFNINNEKTITHNVTLSESVILDECVVVSASRAQRSPRKSGYKSKERSKKSAAKYSSSYDKKPKHNTEDYSTIRENGYKKVTDDPLSTFSIDVDRASYSNVRRFINGNQKPPTDAVRIEEMINYFSYDYPQPQDEHPFSVVTELSECPWDMDKQLVHIGLQGKKMDLEKAPNSNLVFLLDVSGSMDSYNKLDLLKSSLKLLVNNLREEDRVAIVVYAGAAGLVLESTPGTNKNKILGALDNLQAGGSTAGAAGIQLAYKVAKENFITSGNNRIILATDGDFNVGVSSDGELERLIAKKRDDDIFLTVLGFGMGNYKDNKMETLADKGNGNYAYIDNIREANKVLVSEMGGTLYTIAKDVKLQIEFNPEYVQSYRLIGYENRLLDKEDFNNDKKDAGELGAGHTVTALYEIVPAKTKLKRDKKTAVDPLKYQSAKPTAAAKISGELMTVKLRYKQPKGTKSQLISHPISNEAIALEKTSENFRFSAAVAGFGMLLRDSKYKEKLDYDLVSKLGLEAKGADKEGYRAEFLRLVETCALQFAAR